MILSTSAAVAGAALAVLAIQWLARLPQTSGFVSGSVSLVVLVEGAVMTTLIALIGGAYPAWRATQALPTEALRHE